MKRVTDLQIREYDASGGLKAVYLQSSGLKSPTRLHMRLPQPKPIWRRSLDIFLPEGFPASVSEDYVEYQIYDSLQAFACTIAGIISSRAVWQGLGVGSLESTPYMAMLWQVARECTGKFSTIAYAWYSGPSVESETKAYRMAADISCDTAMILDMLSPLVGPKLRMAQLCLSSSLYAASGVFGGSSKSSLSGHFAKWNNLGELNAKESSQETILSLLGMLTGTLLCTFIHDQLSAQIWLLVFLGLHLFLNWMAVRSVKLRTLNRQRANIVFSNLEQSDTVLSPQQVAQQESIFEARHGSIYRWQSKNIVGSCDFGTTMSDLITCVTGNSALRAGKSPFLGEGSLSEIVDLFENERYLLYYHVPEPLWKSKPARNCKVTVVVKDGATAIDQLKAWFHGLVLAKRLNEQQGRDAPILSAENFNNKQRANVKHVASTLRYVNGVFDAYVARLESQGWNCSVPNLETRSSSRVTLSRSED